MLAPPHQPDRRRGRIDLHRSGLRFCWSANETAPYFKVNDESRAGTDVHDFATTPAAPCSPSGVSD